MPILKLSSTHADTLTRVFNVAGIGLLACLENTPTDDMLGQRREATNWAKTFVVESDSLQHRICKPGKHELSDDDITTLYQTMQTFWLLVRQDAESHNTSVPRDIRRAFRKCYEEIWEHQNFKQYLSPQDGLPV